MSIITDLCLKEKKWGISISLNGLQGSCPEARLIYGVEKN